VQIRKQQQQYNHMHRHRTYQWKHCDHNQCLLWYHDSSQNSCLLSVPCWVRCHAAQQGCLVDLHLQEIQTDRHTHYHLCHRILDLHLQEMSATELLFQIGLGIATALSPRVQVQLAGEAVQAPQRFSAANLYQLADRHAGRVQRPQIPKLWRRT